MSTHSAVSKGHCLSYSAPSMASIWMISPVVVIQGIYAKHHGLSLSTIAVVVLIAHLFNAISDPVVGYYSDRYYQRRGTRKPFIAVGGLLLIVSSYCLYVPPQQVGAVYFTFWYMVVYLAWTLFEIPHTAWASDLASSSKDKTLIYTYRAITGYIGMALFYAVPLLPLFDSTEITPATIEVSVIAAGVLMLPLLSLCLKGAPDGGARLRNNTQVVNNSTEKGSVPLKRTGRVAITIKDSYIFLQSILNNRPFLLFVSASLFVSLGSGMWYALIFIYVDTYLGLGEAFTKMFLLAFIVGLISAPLWYKLAVWQGKRNTWAIAVVLIMFSLVYTQTLTPDEASLAQLVALKIIQTLGFACMGVVAPAVLSEIADYSLWKEGAERTATYFALHTFVQKTSGGLASALGFGIAGYYGFDASAKTHNEISAWGLNMAITWVPLLFTCPALIFILSTPINSRRHAIVQRRLGARLSHPH